MKTYKVIEFSVSRGDWDPAGGFNTVEANSLQEAVILAKDVILKEIGKNDGTPEEIEDAESAVEELSAIVLAPESVLYALTTPEVVRTQEYADAVKCMCDDAYTKENTLVAKLAEIASKYVI